MRKIIDAMVLHAKEAGNAIAVSDQHGQLSRRELLAQAVSLAGELMPLPRTVGIYGPNGVAWVIAQLACALSGKIVVPMPTFFSKAQLGHIIRDASVEMILACDETVPVALWSGIPTTIIVPRQAETHTLQIIEGYGQIIYTSGSTGQPKGVRHQSGQIAWSASTLAAATGATAEDRYLSVLPLPLLLETICAIFIPTLLGAYVHFDAALAEQNGRGDAKGISKAFDLIQPTTSVVAPQLLKQWVGELQLAGQTAPKSLRFIAVGGAPLAQQTAEKAWQQGIPVHEGYGLSECCSVVTLNRPGERLVGTVGRPLEGLDVSIDHGEIVVEGPSITDGYLGKGPATRPWRTGDLGAIDDHGFLTIHGRKDSLIVNSFGRNISPEWVETMLLVDLRIAFCAVVGQGAPFLKAVIVPSRSGESWFAGVTHADILTLISDCCSGAPEYAVPRTCIVVSLEEAVANELLTNGRPARKQLEKFVAAKALVATTRPIITNSMETQT
jgi:long-subunit acyl-CoA synthetase (AMP-forming)